MSVIERDGKRWTVADIDELERERDDYKDRWETLGRVSKRMIEKRDEQLQGAVGELEALREAVRAYLNGAPLDEHGRFKNARLEPLYRALGDSDG